jgi:DNA-directed RNA polymerase specialized sigma24 family protein
VPTIDVVDLDEALGRLTLVDGRAAKLVELRFFAGLSVPEAAQVLEISLSTAEGDWRFARSWLVQELAGYDPT